MFRTRARIHKALYGQAEVVWVRDVEEGAGRPRGMGLSFARLDAAGARTIRRLVEQQILSGGSMADFEELMSMSEESYRCHVTRTEIGPLDNLRPPPAPTALAHPRDPSPYTGFTAASAAPRRLHRRQLGLAAALLAAASVAGYLLLLL